MTDLAWLPHVGLLVIGLIYLSATPFQWMLFLAIAFPGLFFTHLLDGLRNKPEGMTYLALFFIWSFVVVVWLISSNQLFASLIFSLCCLLVLSYSFVSGTPLSAFYKGFGFSLLFWLPFGYLDMRAIPIYLVLAVLATISEISHEAYHSGIDVDRCTTAQWLGIRMCLEQRVVVKTFILLLGILTGVILWKV